MVYLLHRVAQLRHEIRIVLIGVKFSSISFNGRASDGFDGGDASWGRIF